MQNYDILLQAVHTWGYNIQLFLFWYVCIIVYTIEHGPVFWYHRQQEGAFYVLVQYGEHQVRKDVSGNVCFKGI